MLRRLLRIITKLATPKPSCHWKHILIMRISQIFNKNFPTCIAFIIELHAALMLTALSYVYLLHACDHKKQSDSLSVWLWRKRRNFISVRLYVWTSSWDLSETKQYQATMRITIILMWNLLHTLHKQHTTIIIIFSIQFPLNVFCIHPFSIPDLTDDLVFIVEWYTTRF